MKAAKSKFKLRELYVLREVRITPDKLEKGDVFRFGKAHKDDKAVDSNEFYVCQKKPQKTAIPGDVSIESKLLIPGETGKHVKFTWGKGLSNG